MLKILNNTINMGKYPKCVLNVSRQIGTTTSLCEYALDCLIHGKNVVYHVDRRRSMDEVFKKMKQLSFDIFDNVFFRICKRTHEITVSFRDIKYHLKVVCGEHNPNDFIGRNNHIDLYIVDNADFFNGYVNTLNFLLGMNEFMQVVIASTPSPFNGTWSMFKKLCVMDNISFKVFAIKNDSYDESLKVILSEEHFNCECCNYSIFFDNMKIIYRNIGELLFRECK